MKISNVALVGIVLGSSVGMIRAMEAGRNNESFN